MCSILFAFCALVHLLYFHLGSETETANVDCKLVIRGARCLLIGLENTGFKLGFKCWFKTDINLSVDLKLEFEVLFKFDLQLYFKQNLSERQ